MCCVLAHRPLRYQRPAEQIRSRNGPLSQGAKNRRFFGGLANNMQCGEAEAPAYPDVPHGNDSSNPPKSDYIDVRAIRDRPLSPAQRLALSRSTGSSGSAGSFVPCMRLTEPRRLGRAQQCAAYVFNRIYGHRCDAYQNRRAVPKGFQQRSGAIPLGQRFARPLSKSIDLIFMVIFNRKVSVRLARPDGSTVSPRRRFIP